MACFFGAHLARSGRVAVTLMGTWRAALSAIAEHGILLEEGGGRYSARVRTAIAGDPVEPVHVVLVLVKSHQTPTAGHLAARALAPRGVAVTLQNGLGNREALQRAVGDQAVVVGVTMAGAMLREPGHVLAYPGKTVLAEGPGQAPALFVELLRSAGLEAELSAHIEPLVWRKLVANCAINPLSALLGVSNGALLEAAESRQTLERAAREAGAVAAAMGIDLGEDPARIATEVARRTAGNRSSMLQDLDREAGTEIDAITGALVREARRLGVPVPVNERLYADVRKREGRPLPVEADA